MGLSDVSQEYSFCACAVLGKIILFRRNTVFAVGSIDDDDDDHNDNSTIVMINLQYTNNTNDNDIG